MLTVFKGFSSPKIQTLPCFSDKVIPQNQWSVTGLVPLPLTFCISDFFNRRSRVFDKRQSKEEGFLLTNKSFLLPRPYVALSRKCGPN